MFDHATSLKEYIHTADFSISDGDYTRIMNSVCRFDTFSTNNNEYHVSSLDVNVQDDDSISDYCSDFMSNVYDNYETSYSKVHMFTMFQDL